MGTSAIRKNVPVAVLGLAAAGLGAAAMMVGNGDAVVERGFQRALADLDKTAASAKLLPVVAGSEDFWLTHLVHDTGPIVTKPVAVGDRITINSGGRDRVLSVVTVDKLDSQVLPISSERPTPLLLVTCRDETNRRGPAGALPDRSRRRASGAVVGQGGAHPLSGICLSAQALTGRRAGGRDVLPSRGLPMIWSPLRRG